MDDFSSVSSVAALSAASPPPVGSFVLSVALREARGLFSADERDDPDAAKLAAKKGITALTGAGAAGAGTAAAAANGAAKAAGSGAGAAPLGAKPSTPDGGRGGSAKPGAGAGKKGKRGAADDDAEAPQFPLHSFVTFAPFEPVLAAPTAAADSNADGATGGTGASAAGAKAPPTPDKRGVKKTAAAAAADAAADEGPAPPQWLHTVQTPVVGPSASGVEDPAAAPASAAAGAVQGQGFGSNPQYKFLHVQRLASRENFLDKIWQAPLVLHVWQYIPLPPDVKKKHGGKPGVGGASAGSGAGGPPGSSHGSRKKKPTPGARGAGGKGASSAEEEEEPRPFGDLDPEQVVKLGEVHVPLAAHMIEQGGTRVSGWFPLLVADETLATARAIATARGRPHAVPLDARPELFVDVMVDRALVDAAEAQRDNRLRITVERVERMPTWTVDVPYLEAVESVKRAQAAKAEAERAAAAAAAAQAGDPNFSLPLGGLATGTPTSAAAAGGSPVRKSSAGHARAGGRSHGGAGGARSGAGGSSSADDANPLDDFPEKEYTDSFALRYTLDLGGGVVAPVVAAQPAPMPAIGLSEAERQDKYGGQLVPEWVAPLREVPRPEELALAAAGGVGGAGAGGKGKASSSAKRPGSGRNTPAIGLEADGAAATTAPAEVQYLPPLEWFPSTPRGALLLDHCRSAYLSSAASRALRDKIARGERFLMQLEHTRTPHDEKAVEAGKTIVQKALALIDLRPLLKPGATEVSGAFVLRQITPPLPVPAPEEPSKKGGAQNKRAGTGTGAGAAAPAGGKRPAGADSSSAATDPAPLLPPETFDEARSFIVVHFRLERPLVPRKTALSVADVLAAASSGASQAHAGPLKALVTETFLSAAADAQVPQPKALLLSEPVTIANAQQLAQQAQQQQQQFPGEASSSPLTDFRAEVGALVREFLAEYQASQESVRSAARAPNPGVTTSRIAHALPPAPSHSVAALPSLSSTLSASGLGVAALERLKPRLAALVEARFFTAAATDPTAAAGASIAHRKNELYMELAREVQQIIRQHLDVQRQGEDGSPLSPDQTAAARQQAISQAARERFDSASTLASHAEAAGALALAARHHSTRLANLLALFESNQQSFPASSPFRLQDLVQAWYEYGAFLLRRQNGAEDLLVDQDGAVRTARKTGSLDGANAAIDLAEECLKQCLRYSEGSFAPALLNLVLVNLEQGEVEHALEFLHRAVAMHPEHPLVLAVQGLYHELAEEDEESAGAFGKAEQCLHAFMQAQHEAVERGEPSHDALMQALLGAHGSDACSLPLLHSQSIGLVLSRYLSSQGFRGLARRVLDKEVALLNAHLSAQEEAQNGEDDSAGDVHQFGPFLELAIWHSVDPRVFDSHTATLLRRAQNLIEQKSIDAHHAPSLLYAFGAQGHVYYTNRRFDDAASSYFMYLSLLQENQLEMFLDPLVLHRAAQLYMRRHVLREAVNLSTMLCSHPLHTHSPFHWALLGQTLAVSGRHAAADEALAEALAKDESCGAAWAVRAQAQLLRLQSDEHARQRHSKARHPAELSPDSVEFDEAHHAFERALSLGCDERHTWIELGRLWFAQRCAWRAEQAYTRALMLARPGSRDEESVREKLRWLDKHRSGQLEPSRESQAATAIQSQLRGALARKQMKKRRLQEAVAEGRQQEEKEQQQQQSF